MANIRITSLPSLTDPLVSDSFVPSSSEFVLEENGVSYKITAAGVLENSSTATANFGDTTITGSFTTQTTTTLASLNLANTTLTLNSEHSGAASDNVSLLVNRGSDSNVSLTWDETNNRWDFGNFPVKAQTFITEDASNEVEYALETIQITAAGGLTGGGDLSEDMNIQVAPNGIDNTMLRNSVATSVVGRSANSTGDPEDIQATVNNRVLARTGDVLGFVEINNNMIPNNTISGSKIVDNSITSAEIGPDAVGSSELANNSVSSANIVNRSITASDIGLNQVGSAELADSITVANFTSNTRLVIPIK